MIRHLFSRAKTWFKNLKPKAADSGVDDNSRLPVVVGDPRMTRNELLIVHRFLDRFATHNGRAVIIDCRTERFWKIEGSEIDAIEYAELSREINVPEEDIA